MNLKVGLSEVTRTLTLFALYVTSLDLNTGLQNTKQIKTKYSGREDQEESDEGTKNTERKKERTKAERKTNKGKGKLSLCVSLTDHHVM
jgi:hypothetical protein